MRCFILLMLSLSLLYSCNIDKYKLPVQFQDNYFEARSSYEMGEYQKAETLFTELSQEVKNNLPVKLQLAKTKIMLGDFDTAEEALQQIIKHAPQYYEAKFWYARLLLMKKNYLEAEQRFLELLKVNGNDSQIYYYLSILYNKEDFSDKDLALSLQYINQANKLSMTQLAYQLNEKARYYMILQNTDKAKNLLQLSLQLLSKDQALYDINNNILAVLENKQGVK